MQLPEMHCPKFMTGNSMLKITIDAKNFIIQNYIKSYHAIRLSAVGSDPPIGRKPYLETKPVSRNRELTYNQSSGSDVAGETIFLSVQHKNRTLYSTTVSRYIPRDIGL